MKHQYVKMIPPTGMSAYLPANDEAEKLFRKQQNGDRIEGNLHGIRSLKEHNRFFAMVRDAHSRFDTNRSFDQFRTDLTMEAGYYEACVGFNGQAYKRPESLNYANLDAREFQDLHSKVLDVIINCCGFDEETQVYFIQNYNVPHLEESA